MRLFDSYPYGFSGHDTSGDHATKHSTDPAAINDIRMAVLGSSVQPWDTRAVYMIMEGDDGELVNAYDESNRSRPMVGGLLIHYELNQDDPRHKAAVIDASDVVVSAGHQGNTLGRSLVGMGLQKQVIGPNFNAIRYPSELVITDRHGVADTDKLLQEGLTQTDDGSFSAPLAGTHMVTPMREAGVYERETAKMQDAGWTGYFEYLPEDDNDTTSDGPVAGYHAYRDGQLVGIVREAPDTKLFYDDYERMTRAWDYLSADGDVVESGVVQPARGYLAVSDMVQRLS